MNGLFSAASAIGAGASEVRSTAISSPSVSPSVTSIILPLVEPTVMALGVSRWPCFTQMMRLPAGASCALFSAV